MADSVYFIDNPREESIYHTDQSEASVYNEIPEPEGLNVAVVKEAVQESVYFYDKASQLPFAYRLPFQPTPVGQSNEDSLLTAQPASELGQATGEQFSSYYHTASNRQFSVNDAYSAKLEYRAPYVNQFESMEKVPSHVPLLKDDVSVESYYQFEKA